MLKKFSEKNWEGEGLDTTERDSGNRKHRPKARERQTEAHAYTEKNVTNVDELEDQTQTHHYTTDVQMHDGSNTD